MDHEFSPKGWLFGPWKVGRFSFVISRDDLWVGFYWGRDDGCLYFCPLPMCVFGFRFIAKKEYLPSLPYGQTIDEFRGN